MYASALDDKHTIVTVPRSRLHSSASQRLRTDRPHPNRHAHARTNPLPSLLSPLPLSSPFLPPFLPLPFPLPPSTPPLPSSGPARGITVCVARPRTAAAGGATTTTKSAVSRAERNQCSAGAERGWGGKKGAALAFYGPAADGERRTRRRARQAMPAPHQERLKGGGGDVAARAGRRAATGSGQGSARHDLGTTTRRDCLPSVQEEGGGLPISAIK